jgi:TatD DNase family protein
MKDSVTYIDTHCHIHDKEFEQKFLKSPEQMLDEARKAGVEKIICVGTSLASSQQAVAFAEKHNNVYASIALHPHEAERLSGSEITADMAAISRLTSDKIVAVGECGLDYFYHDDAEIHRRQDKLLRAHLELAKKRHLPMIFHVRNAKNGDGQGTSAFTDFMKRYDKYSLPGVMHSFSATDYELDLCVSRDLLIGLNGIMTFTTDENQLKAARKVPLANLVVETDAPYLTPKPFRGNINEPKHVTNITQFLSELRGESLALVAKQTTKNAKKLFNL